MRDALEARGITVTFLEQADGRVYVGYETHRNDAADLVTELAAVVTAVLDRQPRTAVTGTMLHTERPVLGTWRVEPGWAERLADGSLPENALVAEVLGTLRTASFA